jgi:hypothetical protein
MNGEQRAPGWRIRCLKCGFVEPWSKYGIRIGASGTSYTLGRCDRCRRIRIHAVERSPTAETENKKGNQNETHV